MKVDYILRIKRVKQLLEKYYEKDFESEIEDSIKNTLIKKKLLQIILDCHSDDIDKLVKTEEREYILNEALHIFQENTGCAEDLQLLQEAMNQLVSKSIISLEKSNSIMNNNAASRFK